MRLTSSFSVSVVGAISLLPAAYAWGAAGHEIIATIAQIYLHPSVLPTLCGILNEPHSRCHLASIANWADEYQSDMMWSAPLHYIGAIDDNPPYTCVYPGPNGWAGRREVNVLDGIKNVTELLQDWANDDASDEVASEALKFLVHLVGDMHQPLHLTGRDRGGSSTKVTWGGRETTLHSLWDDYLIANGILSVPMKYFRPMPYPKVEDALQGTIYDSYIRRIMWKGTLTQWDDEFQGWLSCSTPTPESSTFPSEGTWQKVLSGLGLGNSYTRSTTKKGVDINPDAELICPYFWSQALNALNCDIVWPKELDYNLRSVRTQSMELDTPGYAGVIEERMLVEKVLAQGGIRLAAILNYLFAYEEMGGTFVMDLKA